MLNNNHYDDHVKGDHVKDDHVKGDHVKDDHVNDDNSLNAFSSFFTKTLPSVTASVSNSVSDTVSFIPSLPLPLLFGDKSCTIKLIHISDVNELDQLAHYSTCKEWNSPAAIGTISSDLLYPSLLSSLDNGDGLIDVLNKCNIDYLCIGNHDVLIPKNQLYQRIKQSKFTWINSNIDIPLPEDITLPTYSIVKVKNRKVALLGLSNVFGGAKIREVKYSCKKLYEEIKSNEPDVDVIIPITNQIMPLDRELAEEMGEQLPVILGGMDREHFCETINGCTVVKTGNNAKMIGIIELYWADDNKDTKPKVTINLKPPAEYSKNLIVQKSIDSYKSLLTQLESGTLCKIPSNLQLSSKLVRIQPVTMATFICSLVKDALSSDCCILAASTIRADKDYTNQDRITYYDIVQEVPFETIIVNIELPGSVICESIEYTRIGFLSGTGGYLQTDENISWNSKKNNVKEINGLPVKKDQMYIVSINQMLLEGLESIKPLVDYIAKTRKRPFDSGIGLKELILRKYGKLFLFDILKNSGEFNEIINRDDDIWNKEEFMEIIMKSGDNKSTILVDTLFSICDNKNEIIQLAIEAEILLGLSQSHEKIGIEEHKALLKATLGNAYNEATATTIFKKIDVDKNGYITHGEHRSYQKKQLQQSQTNKWSLF